MTWYAAGLDVAVRVTSHGPALYVAVRVTSHGPALYVAVRVTSHGPALYVAVRVTSHGPVWGRLGARASWRSQVSSGRCDAQTCALDRCQAL